MAGHLPLREVRLNPDQIANVIACLKTLTQSARNYPPPHRNVFLPSNQQVRPVPR